MKDILGNRYAAPSPSPFGGGLGWGFSFYHLKIALRNLRQNGLYSWINIGGLAVSITAVVLIMFWVTDEWNYDRFFNRSSDIYRVISRSTADGKEDYWEYTQAPLAKWAKDALPDAEAACSFGYDWELGYLEYRGQKYFGKLMADYAIADTSFFEVFDAEFVEGSARNAFPEAQSIVVTDELARTIFGSNSALGQTLKGSNGKEYHVSAVIKKPRQNTALQFKALISFEQSPDRKDNWRQSSSFCYLKLRPGADPDQSGVRLTDEYKTRMNSSADISYLMQPLTKAHLYAPDGSETGMKNVRLFTIIAAALLVVGCINYVNLVTARMRKRAKEIGLRKIVGAGKSRLFMQIMGESVLLFFFSVILSAALLLVAAPYFEAVTGRQLNISLFDTRLLSFYSILFSVVTLLAAIYPAVLLSSRKPLEIFGSPAVERKGQLSLRRVLVVLQFSCSAALIAATVVMGAQQRYMKTTNPGYGRENILTVDVLANRNFPRFYEAFKSELLQQTEISGVAVSTENVIDVQSRTDGISWTGKPDDLSVTVATLSVDRDLMPLLGISLAEGIGFSETPADSFCYLVNETAVKQMGLADPLNTPLDISWLRKGRIVGVVKDFHFRHMREPVGPVVMFLGNYPGTLYIKTAPGKTREALATAERIWKKYDADYPFNYTFMDDTFAALYAEDTRTDRLFNAFAVIAVLISCLGLFGLATYAAETKTREIGIRKVLGASVASIVRMLSKEFLVLVGMAMLIAFPLAYYWLDGMLQDYAYRIDISWWMFALAGMITVALTLITVGWKAVKAATANPVRAIKSE